VFPAEFTPKPAGKSAEKARGSSNGWTCYKESRSESGLVPRLAGGGSAPDCLLSFSQLLPSLH